jgi:hypothetical protein
MPFNEDLHPRDSEGRWALKAAVAQLLAEHEGENRPYPSINHDAAWRKVSLNGRTLSEADTERTGGGNTALRASGELSAHEVNAINEYVAFDDDTQRINRKLRAGVALTPEEAERNAALDSVARKASLAADADLWRAGMPIVAQPGDIVQDKGYLSASFQRDVAEYYGAERGEHTMYQIKGQQGAPIIPARGDEMVLPAGAAMRVVSVEDGVTVLEYSPPKGEAQVMGFSQPIELSAKTAMYSVKKSPLGEPGGPGLFHDKSLSLPAYIENIAKSLMKKRGMSKSRAIATAIAVCKRWAAGVGNVSPEVRAAAAKAIAEWNAARAKAKATPNKTSHSNDSIVGTVIDLANKKKKDKQSSSEKHRREAAKEGLPPGAVGYKHGWIPVDANGNPVGRRAKEGAKQNADTEKLLKEGMAKHAAALAGKEGKKAATEARKKLTAAKAAARAKMALLKAVVRQAEADKKAGRPLTPAQKRALARYEVLKKAAVASLRAGKGL